MKPPADRLTIAHLIAPRSAGDPACAACAAMVKHAPDWAHHSVIAAMHSDDEPRYQLLGLQPAHRISPGATASLSRSRQLTHIWRTLGDPPDILLVWPGMPLPAPVTGTTILSTNRLDAGPWPVDCALIDAHDREEVRTAWDVPAGAHAIVAIAEPAAACDAWIASFLGAVMTLSTPPLWAIVPAGADQIDRGLRFAERHRHAWQMIVDDAPLPRLLAGADAAVHALSQTWGQSSMRARADGLAWAAAHALPVITEDSSAIDNSTPYLSLARITPQNNRKELAHAVSRSLLDDKADARGELARSIRTACDPLTYSRRAHEHLRTLAPIHRLANESAESLH